MLEGIKEKKKVIGTKQSKRVVLEEKVKYVYIAEDADKRIINELVVLCKEKNIDVIYAESMKELGKASGIDVGAASVAILK